MIVLSGFLGLVSYDAYRTSQFEQDLRSDIPAAVDASTGPEVELMDIAVRYDDPVPFQQPQRVVVTVGVPLEDEPPNLSEVIEQRADTRIQSAFDPPGIGPLIDANRAEIDVRYVLRES